MLLGPYGWRLRDLQIDSEAVASAVRDLSPFAAAGALRIVYRTYAAKFGKQRWGDKSPHYLGHMPLISDVLPEARFIHVIRDGRAVWQSIRSLWFGPSTVEDAAIWWSDAIAAARQDAARIPHYLEVRFEDLVRSPADTLQRVCAFLELEWDPAMLRAHERAPERVAEVITDQCANGRLVATVSERRGLHRLTGSPPDATRISAWQRELPPADVAVFEFVAAETLQELGYLD